MRGLTSQRRFSGLESPAGSCEAPPPLFNDWLVQRASLGSDEDSSRLSGRSSHLSRCGRGFVPWRESVAQGSSIAPAMGDPNVTWRPEADTIQLRPVVREPQPLASVGISLM